jgi:Cu+-exporting ATPase
MTNQTVHDPICHMDITIETAAGSSTWEGKTYYFCSPGCKKDFDDDPPLALKNEAEHDHSQPGEPMMMMPDPVSAAPAAAKKPWWRFW